MTNMSTCSLTQRLGWQRTQMQYKGRDATLFHCVSICDHFMFSSSHQFLSLRPSQNGDFFDWLLHWAVLQLGPPLIQSQKLSLNRRKKNTPIVLHCTGCSGFDLPPLSTTYFYFSEFSVPFCYSSFSCHQWKRAAIMGIFCFIQHWN